MTELKVTKNYPFFINGGAVINKTLLGAFGKARTGAVTIGDSDMRNFAL